MRPMPAPLTLSDSATPVTAALKSSRMMEMTNQIMRGFLSEVRPFPAA